MPKLIISDLHLRFEHERALEHCLNVYEAYGCDSVLCTGDLIDHHKLSRFTSEPDADGALSEFYVTKRKMEDWIEAFPVMDIMLGNHDLIPFRQAKELGIPKIFMKRLEDCYEMPKTWKMHKKLVEDDVLYLHSAGSGMNAAMNKARKMSMSVVCGHTHQNGGIVYFSNPKHLFFGLNVGCLIDKTSYAMRYFDGEPTLGCGVVVSSEEAYFIPLKMGGR